ncbi:MAG: SMC family ATPase [Candidatus Aenigmatarchaeota archaeon]
MITNIKLKNWRSHLSTEITFSEGTNCFIGTMGAGKTSILDAMCFALFGTFPTLNSKKLRLEDVIMKKPKQQQTAEVVVTFEIDSDTWTVARKITKGKTTAELRKNGVLVESPQSTKVTEEIEKILKIDYDLFTRAIYSEQNQLDMFLTIPKGQRMRRIDELLAIDKFEKARQTVLALINKTKAATAERQALAERLASDPELQSFDRLNAELAATMNEAKALERQLNSAKEGRARAEARLAKLREFLTQLSELDARLATEIALQAQTQEDINRLSCELTADLELSDSELNERLSAAEHKLAEIKAGVAADREHLDELKGLTAADMEKIRTLEEERIPELTRTIEEVEKLKAELKRHPVKKLVQQLEEKREELERKSAALQRAEGRIASLEESLSELKAAGDFCPICDSSLSTKRKNEIIERKQRAISKLRSDLTKLPDEIAKIKAEIKDLEILLREATKIEDRIVSLAGAEASLKAARLTVKQLNEQIMGRAKEIKMLEKTIAVADKAMESERATVERLRGLLNRRKELTEKMNKLKEHEANISRLKDEKRRLPPISPAEIRNAESELASAITAESTLAARMNAMAAIISEKSDRIKLLNARKAELNAYLNDVKRMSAITDQLMLLESALVATQEQLRRNFVTAVNQAMQSLWGALYPYKDFFSIRLGIEEGDYVLQLQDSTGWVPADGVASGGERSIACLALRMAFALVLAPQLRWLVLDEPTHNLDAKAVDDLATVLRDRIGEFVEQVFLITHDPALEAAVTGYLYRFERDKERDGYTKIISVSGPDKV